MAVAPLASPLSAADALPTIREVKAALPADVWDRRLGRSLAHLALSIALTFGTAALAAIFLPVSLAWAPVWIAYAIVVGTFACGIWVVAHECGHRAFCNGTRLQDSIGFVLHSFLLVPYFSWQRSHAIHHAKTNHLTEGETHVPKVAGTPSGDRNGFANRRLGRKIHAALTLAGRLLIGWPAYLLFGATGGSVRGNTNHFWPFKPFSDALFGERWRAKVLVSAAGVLAMLAVLTTWAVSAGSLWPVIALYGGPYLVNNMWLVGYTWLQHTEPDVPHYDTDEWSFVRGAFCSVDRPYGKVFDLVHHRIGSTHVAHHIDAKIPHYNADRATAAIREAYPDLYRYNPTPVPTMLWRAARDCHVVERAGDGWRFRTD